jgi:hypothetical protein
MATPKWKSSTEKGQSPEAKVTLFPWKKPDSESGDGRRIHYERHEKHECCFSGYAEKMLRSFSWIVLKACPVFRIGVI